MDSTCIVQANNLRKFFGSTFCSILPKNEGKQLDLSTWGTTVVKSIIFVNFLGELMIPKRHFEINRPLVILFKFCNEMINKRYFLKSINLYYVVIEQRSHVFW